MHDFLKDVMQMNFENAEVSVIRSNRKTISIQVKPNEVIIRAPFRMKEKEIEKFAESKRNWIEKHLKSLSEKQKALENIEPFSDEEIRSLVAKAKEIIPGRVEFYADIYNRRNLQQNHNPMSAHPLGKLFIKGQS